VLAAPAAAQAAPVPPAGHFKHLVLAQYCSYEHDWGTGRYYAGFAARGLVTALPPPLTTSDGSEPEELEYTLRGKVELQARRADGSWRTLTNRKTSVGVARDRLPSGTSPRARVSVGTGKRVVRGRAVFVLKQGLDVQWRATITRSLEACGVMRPLKGIFMSGFGPRWGRMHQGIDISAPTGTAVKAAAGGRIVSAGSTSGYGNMIVVDHGGGLTTAYAHLSSIWVPRGSVSQGQPIGAVGCTGSCTGPHLHFEVRVKGSPMDPRLFF
jgi:hypothetical protein